MCLISIVAREDFISVVSDQRPNEFVSPREVTIKSISTKNAFIACSGNIEYSEMTISAAETLLSQGFSLYEIAEAITESLNCEINTENENLKEFEAIIGGYSSYDKAQFHIISPNTNMKSYYPAENECLYYVHGLTAMSHLKTMLHMHGMATSEQAQSAQLHFLREASKIIPNVHSTGHTHLIQKFN